MSKPKPIHTIFFQRIKKPLATKIFIDTGFPNVKIFMSVFELVGNPTQYYGYLKKCLNENLGRKRFLDPEETFFFSFSGQTEFNSSVVGYIGSFMNTELINIHQVFKIAFTLLFLLQIVPRRNFRSRNFS
jgi:hypothetical protein